MNTYRTGRTKERCEVDLYYEACERLDHARAQRPVNNRRVSMLTYAVGITLDRAQDALAGRERSVDEKIKGLFADLKRCMVSEAHSHLLTGNE